MIRTLLLGCGLASAAATAATFTVDSTEDAVDASPGDGSCLTDTGACTLRAAVMEANASAGADVIDLSGMNDPATPITLSLAGVDETFVDSEEGAAQPCVADITADASIGDLDITEDLEIVGAGPALTVIEWDQQSIEDPNVGDRIFHVQAPAGATVDLVRIADVMVTRGSVGIPNSTDPANPYNCDVSGEEGAIEAWQFRRFGGAIAAGPGAAVVLFQEAEHGPGSGGGSDEGGPPEDHEEEEEGGVSAVELERVAVIGNQSGSDAGGVIAAAELTLSESVLSGNTSEGNGGALYLDSGTTIRDTLIGASSSAMPYPSGALEASLLGTGNQAENGGGIFDTGSHSTYIERSAINGNQAIGGGGIAGRALVVINVTNTTVSGNTGTDVGGGITTNGTVNLRNVTVANNTATTDAPGGGGGLNSFGDGTFTFFNSILANNVVAGGDASREANCGCSGGGAQCPPGRMVSTGHNINDETLDTCSLEVSLDDQPATDPLLADLANNGGLTETHALPSTATSPPAAATSPAIDAGDDQRCPNNDQRGSLRADDGDLDGTYACDIGAFELFIPRSDLHINNVTMPNRMHKGEAFEAVVEIHNDDGNAPAPGVTLDGTLDPATGLAITDATTTAGTCTVASSDAVSCDIGEMAIGAVETVTLSLTGGTQGDYALDTVIDQTGDPALVDTDTGNNSVTSRVYVYGNADLAVTGGAQSDRARLGEEITLDYTVTNNGEDDASDARFGMVLPTSVSFVSATASQGDCALSAGEVLCTIGDLTMGAPVSVQIVVTGDESGEIAFEGLAAAEQEDPDETNNSTVSTVTVLPEADLELVASSPAAVRQNDEFTVSFAVRNNGPQDAPNVVVTGMLPSAVEFIASDACSVQSGQVTCTLASAAVDSGALVTMRVAARQLGSTTVSASVGSDDATDPDASNNEDSLTILIREKSDSGGCVYRPGGPVDPLIPGLLLLSILGLVWRRRTAAERS